MNRNLLRKYISEYEKNFDEIHREEIYKWQAVKQFQESWDPNTEDFVEMLSSSLSKTSNLMESGNYFPKGMIEQNAEKNPSAVKDAFLDLFEEDNDLLERITSFRTRIKELNSREFPGKNDYQDHRAVMVYLNLRYPDTYFLYKFGMFKTFCEKIDHNYTPKAGHLSNIVQYMYLCENVREEILLNNSLLKLHKERIGEDEFFDANFNILTQDFIYAVTNYLAVNKNDVADLESKLVVRNIRPKPLKKKVENIRFEGKSIDFVSQQKRNKRIGDRGEELVLAHERAQCNPKYRDNIVHSSKTEGDGLGYDILSFDDDGNEKFIEVKTTSRDESASFFLSRTELERSKKEGKGYFLYRLFNYDDKNETAECYILSCDLSEYCDNPTQYEILPDVGQSERLDHS